MNKIFYTIIFCFTFFYSKSQNLVINPSFEDTLTCDDYFILGAEPHLPCIPWFLATLGSADYFNIHPPCSKPVPDNIFGYQFARTGNAYCGLTVKLPTINYREYIEGVFIDTLKSGHSYCVSFYVSNANYCKYSSDRIEAYISSDSIFNQNIATVLDNYNPQVVNIIGNILNDTIGWTLISSNYIAQGGEKFITIGNFKNDTITAIDTLNANQANSNSAYYYIDDVSVIDCTTGIEEVKNTSIKFLITPNPAKNKIEITLSKNHCNNTSIQVLNTLGEVLLEQTVAPNATILKVDVTNFSRGIYFVKLITDKGFGVAKFLKE